MNDLIRNEIKKTCKEIKDKSNNLSQNVCKGCHYDLFDNYLEADEDEGYGCFKNSKYTPEEKDESDGELRQRILNKYAPYNTKEVKKFVDNYPNVLNKGLKSVPLNGEENKDA